MIPSLPYLGLGSAESLQQVADAFPDGVFTTDRDGVITYWNPAAGAITGYSAAEAIGRTCALLAGDMGRGCMCGGGPVRCGISDRGKSSKCCSIRTKDGRERLIVKNAVAFHGPDGTVAGALESFTDVTDLSVGAIPWESACALPAPSAGVAAAAEAAPPESECAGLLGCHPVMRELYRMIALVARSDATVMILGESGVGKERVAEAIHRQSRRAAGPLVRVSCSALNENLLESELFGHVKGAFTGALRDRRGRFQEAHGGTLLLDEIGDISPAVQVKLLRVIEQRVVERVGDSQPLPVDVRLLCATHRDLKQLVTDGRFRADLYFRLAVFPLRVPPLRERAEDVALLSEGFLARLGAPPPSPEASRLLAAYAWPGNVRELQNVLEYAALQAGGAPISPAHLPAEIRGAAPPTPERAAPDRSAIVEALIRTGWNRARAADVLGISRVTLWKRMKRLGVVGPGPMASGREPL
ncbi:sigma-54-dependent Fis family transcriptional regulator [Anaeromyxobacter sp. Fw109-5]|uniref:sigma-54 interaction domain-containing protein n=1 Tax=Anaeromyxobacter sp. (strain Fw109-5) TaxID=404589 RepID=UPI0000ED7B44|nr:sigma-54-dependent Fis family transcriptional regulator [Anaeromyxobacter sp. Fw109-5]ABS24306.1 sigma54 specific transcriptional regulator, Fis family [Anaeromyxobacter sp. Fw109-5]